MSEGNSPEHRALIAEATRLLGQARARRLATVGPAIPESWSLAVEQAYPGVWPRYRLQLPKGWIDLALAFSEHLSAIAPDCHVEDSKEKYGCARITVTGAQVPDEAWVIEQIYEDLSATICQDCGEAGRLRDDRGWILTLCDIHDRERAR